VAKKVFSIITRRQWPFSSFIRPTFETRSTIVAEEVGRGGEIEKIVTVRVMLLVNLGKGFLSACRKSPDRQNSHLHNLYGGQNHSHNSASIGPVAKLF